MTLDEQAALARAEKRAARVAPASTGAGFLLREQSSRAGKQSSRADKRGSRADQQPGLALEVREIDRVRRDLERKAAEMRLEETIGELARGFGIDPRDLNLELGPLGRLI